MNKRYSTTFKIHFTAAGARKTIGGVDYAIYPSVLLVEGVHHGMIGAPTMYPNEVLSASAPMWNNIPVTINHPQDQTGAYVSANSPAILQAWAVGKLLNGRFEDGKLKADVMIDIKKANAKDSTLIGNLDKGAEMELSTGLFGEEVVENGMWNNETYASKLTSIQPDHLALLPNSTGACSWADGCGIRANENQGPAVNQSKEDYQKVKVLVVSHDGIRKQLYTYLEGMDQRRTIDRGPFKYHYLSETFSNYFVYEEESEEGSKLFRQSYTVNADDQIVVSDDKTQVQKKVEYVPIQNNAKKENTMADKNKKCCPDRVASLIANEATTYTAEDSEWLLTLNEDQLGKLETNAKGATMPDCGPDGKGPNGVMPCKKVAKANEDDPTKGVVKTNAAQDWKTFMDSAPAEFRAVINAGTRALDAKRTELMTKIKANALNTFTDEEMKVMPDVVLEKLAAVAAVPETRLPNYSGAGGPAFQTNAGGTEEAYVPATIDFSKK